jgi:hypothetical protein
MADPRPARAAKQQNATSESGNSQATENLSYSSTDSAQMGKNRGPKGVPRTSGHRGSQQPSAAFEGSIATRAPEGERQGISTHSSSEESVRQKEIVKRRPDAQAGVNSLKKRSA